MENKQQEKYKQSYMFKMFAEAEIPAIVFGHVVLHDPLFLKESIKLEELLSNYIRPNKSIIGYLNDFIELGQIFLDKVVVKTDYSNSHLINNLYLSDDIIFKSKNDEKVVNKLSFVLAYKTFLEICEEYIYKPENEKEVINNIINHEEILVNFVKDLLEIINKLDPEFPYSYKTKKRMTPYELFLKTEHLLHSSLFTKGQLIDHELGLALCPYTLRQSLEVKFREIIGIRWIYYIKNGKPKIVRHDFIIEFLIQNAKLFNLDKSYLREIKKLYMWTNFFIHTGLTPKFWMIYFAHKHISQLFDLQKFTNDDENRIHFIWNGNITITNYNHIKSLFISYLNNKYEEELDVIFFNKPNVWVDTKDN